MLKKLLVLIPLVLASITVANSATIDFETFSPGDIVTGETISGVILNVEPRGTTNGEIRELMIFDGTCSGSMSSCSGNDQDLFFPNFGNILIISEDNNSNDPDDSAFGGDIIFSFTTDAFNISIDVLDVENGGPNENWVSAYLDGQLVDRIFVFSGDNEFDTATFASDLIADQIIVHLHGSGAVDNLDFTVIPIPAALPMFIFGMMGLFSIRKIAH